ncbi:MAG: hypothetical protein HY270_03300 [Deltaproteobacteria bacterium]|nr:hypothetical protein [Deltaproteobacteria bacterium]
MPGITDLKEIECLTAGVPSPLNAYAFRGVPTVGGTYDAFSDGAPSAGEINELMAR